MDSDTEYILYEASPPPEEETKQVDMKHLDEYDYKLNHEDSSTGAVISGDYSPHILERAKKALDEPESSSGAPTLSDIDSLTLSCFSKNKYKKFLKNMNFEEIRDIDYKKYRHEIMDYTNRLLEDNNTMAAHNKKIQTAFEDYVYHLTQHFDFEENLLQDKEYKKVRDYDDWVERRRGGGGHGGYK